VKNPPRRLSASPPLRKGGTIPAKPTLFLSPPYEGAGAERRYAGSVGEDFERVQPNR
jgi:hypothetical protein